jgi:hypothetical protein
VAERRTHLPKNGGASPAPPLVHAFRVAMPRSPTAANDNRAPLSVRLRRWSAIALIAGAAAALAALAH